MATRSRTSFQKRQKEIARMEKQRDKAAKRAQRKLNPAESEESEYLLGEDGLPVLGEDGQPILIDDGSGDDNEADDTANDGVAASHGTPSIARTQCPITDGPLKNCRRSVSAGRLQWNCGTWDSSRTGIRVPTSLTASPTGSRPFTL